MKAKFIFEAFRRGGEQDIRKSLNVGYGKMMKTSAWKILEFIEESGEEGRSLTEIQYFIWTELNGKDPESFWKKDRSGLRQSRGYWTTNLYGSGYFGNVVGLLSEYCKKNDKGKWILVDYPEPRTNMFKRKK